MPSTFTQLSFREILLREFDTRKKKNGSYSLRAFARDLEIPAPKLSLALRGKKGFSHERAKRITEKLLLGEEESELFIELVRAEHARSHMERSQAREKVKSLRTVNAYSTIELERFRIISDWYHFAILELSDLNHFNPEPKWIAEKLDISLEEAKDAIQRLFDFGFVVKTVDGKWKRTENHLATSNGIPSSEIREYHRQIIGKAQESIEKTTFNRRDLSAMTMSIDEKNYQKATQLIKKFRRDLTKIMQDSSARNRVYCLSIQFFPLDKETNEKV